MFFYWGGMQEHTLYRQLYTRKYNNCAEKANLFAPHYCSDYTFLLSSTLKLTPLESYKSVQVGFKGR